MIVGEVLLFRRRARRGSSERTVDANGSASTTSGSLGSRRPAVVIVPRGSSSDDATAHGGLALHSAAAGADDTTVQLERRDDWFDVDAPTSSVDTFDDVSDEPVHRDQLSLFEWDAPDDSDDDGPPAHAPTERIPVIDLTADVDAEALTAGHVTSRATLTVDSRIDAASVAFDDYPRLPLRPIDLRACEADARSTAVEEPAARSVEDHGYRDLDVPKWDRPRPPRDWRWYVGLLGRTLTSTGLLLFAFVAYQLYGTAIENAASQRALEDEFAERLSTLSVEAAPVDESAPTDGLPDTSSDPVATPTPDSSADGATVDAAADAPAQETATEPDATIGPTESIDDTVDAGPADSPADDATSGVAAALAAATPATEQILPAVDDGAALFQLQIPAIGVDDIVVAGIGNDDLKKGPGHFPDTPMPGQLGNAAIAGHRTTYGQPFHDVDRLEVGDEITVNTWNGTYVYRVTGQQIVEPSQYEVVATTDLTTASLTLISCHPKFTAQQRIVITSELVSASSDPVGVPVLDHGRAIGEIAFGTDVPVSDEPLGGGLATEGEAEDPIDTAATTGDAADEAGAENAGSADGSPVDAASTDTTDQSAATDRLDPAAEAALAVLASAETNDAIAEAFGDGWFSDPGAFLQILFWGLALIAISVAAYLISRRARRDLVGAVVGILPFVVALYFFFQNVHRLLPPNL